MCSVLVRVGVFYARKWFKKVQVLFFDLQDDWLAGAGAKRDSARFCRAKPARSAPTAPAASTREVAYINCRGVSARWVHGRGPRAVGVGQR